VVADETEPAPDIRKVTQTQRRSQDAHALRPSWYEEAAQLRLAGLSIAGIAASLGGERKTIRRWLRAGRVSVWRCLLAPAFWRPIVPISMLAGPLDAATTCNSFGGIW
jgi:hypothetical protein